MARQSWKNRQPNSLRQAMEWCLEHARVRHNRSVDNIADLMGLSNKWIVYKWMESGRLPSILIRPFEVAFGIEYVTRYIGHSAHKGINQLQASFSESMGLLIKFHDGEATPEETAAALVITMEQLAWHKKTVECTEQPEFGFMEDSSND